jgi:hypothetical protein
MRGWLWVNGRFAWPIVGVIVFFTLSLLVDDLVWRLVKLQSATFLFYAATSNVALISALVFIIYLLHRRFK